MPSAVLEIRGDSSGVLRALAQVEPAARRVAASLSAAFRRADTATVESARQASRKIAQAYAQAAASATAAANAAAGMSRRATQRQNDDARAGAGYRSNQYRGEAREAARTAEQIAAARERGERRATAASVREAGRRAAVDRQRAREAAQQGASDRRFGGRVSAAVTAGVHFAGQANGMMQDARGRRASSQHTMNDALYQAGAGAGEGTRGLRERVYSFARTHGMDSGQLADAMNTAQTEFSVLGNSRSSQAERSANVDSFLQTQLFARNTGQNGAEVARVSGMLQNAGLDAGARHSTLLALTGMAQSGAVELGSVSREAMSPMLQRMHDARTQLLQRNPQATPQEIAAEQGGAAQAAFAEIEIARGQGAAPRRFARVMASLGTELQGSHRQGALLNNIEHAHDITTDQRTQLRGMFDHGRLRAQFQSGVGFAGRVQQVLGGNESAMRNIFAGGGHGNAQGLQTNWRDAIAQMMSGGPELQRMLNGAGHVFTDNDEARGAGLRDEEDQTGINRDNENRDAALTTNTGALQGLSNAFTSFVARNPLLAAGGSAAAGLLGPGAASALGAAAPGLARGAAGLIPGAIAAGGGGLMGAGIAGAAALAAGGVGLAAGEGFNRRFQLGRGDGRVDSQAYAAGNAPSALRVDTWVDAMHEVRDALLGGHVVAGVAPAVAAAAVAQSRTGGSVTPAGTGR